MTLEEFKGLTGAEMCERMNKHMENHTIRGFKSGDMAFTFQQAEKALEKNGVYKINGVYRTEEEMLSYLEGKKKERDKKELSQGNIEQLIELLKPGNYERLMRLVEKYDYVSNFILREDRGIKIKTGAGEIHSTSFRIYGDTLKRWKEFTKENRAYSALDLLNTAMVEFMDKHEF